MRELVGGKNTIGRTAAVLKSPIKRLLALSTVNMKLTIIMDRNTDYLCFFGAVGGGGGASFYLLLFLC